MKMSRLAILISGSGTTAEAVIRASRSGKLANLKPVVLISNIPEATGLAKAKALGVDIMVVERKGKTMTQFSNDLLHALEKSGADLVSQNGWLPLTPPPVITAFKGRIINQHPGPLDPGKADFGGKGMYGRRVTAARIAYAWITGEDHWTEATTHHVTEEFDKGGVIRTEILKMPSPSHLMTIKQLKDKPDDLIQETMETTKKLLPLEHVNVIETLSEFAKHGKFPTMKRSTPLVHDRRKGILDEVKELAIAVFPNG
jgi:phosphoribosylglycinamide formyltransferase 1